MKHKSQMIVWKIKRKKLRHVDNVQVGQQRGELEEQAHMHNSMHTSQNAEEAEMQYIQRLLIRRLAKPYNIGESTPEFQRQSTSLTVRLHYKEGLSYHVIMRLWDCHRNNYEYIYSCINDRAFCYVWVTGEGVHVLYAPIRIPDLRTYNFLSWFSPHAVKTTEYYFNAVKYNLTKLTTKSGAAR